MMRRQVYEWRGLIPSTTYPTPYVLNQDPILTLSPAIPAWGTHANAQVDIFVGGLGNNLDIPGYVKATQFIVIDEQFIDDVTTTGSPSFNKEATNNFMVYENSLLPPTQHVSFTYTPNWFIMKINEVYYKWKINQSFAKDKWYAIVINLNATARQLGLFVYNTIETTGAVNPNLTATLNLIYNKTQTATPQTVIDGQSWKLFGCETDLTNIRIWKKPIEEELQSLILSQYVVKDTHLTLLLDNASPELMLQDVTDAR